MGNTILWIPIDTSTNNPIYELLHNGTINSKNSWVSGVEIEVNIDGLSIGIHNNVRRWVWRNGTKLHD